MPSRPQFSLRTLLIVMVLVCLAAATVRLSPEGADAPQHVAARLRAYLRLAGCVLFPAILTSWAVAKGGRGRAFCLGALLPAAMPMLLVCFYATALRHSPLEQRPSRVIEEVTWLSSVWAERITGLWICALLAGICSVFFRWFLPAGDVDSAEARQSFIVRVSLVVFFLAFVSGAIMALPDSSRTGAGVSVFRQAPIRLTFCFVFPSVLAVSAVESRDSRRAFCACALFPALAPVLLALVGDAIARNFDGRWEPSLLYEWRYFIVAMWGLVPCFGLTAAGFYWLFRRGDVRPDDGG